MFQRNYIQFVLAAAWLLVAARVGAQVLPEDFLKKEKGTHSRSGQFIVHPSPFASTQPKRNIQPAPLGEGAYIWSLGNPVSGRTNKQFHLEPALVAVSCERIKEALLNELDERDLGWRRIHVELNSRLRQEQTTILPTKYVQGWVYSIELPVDVDRDFYTASILNVLLLDLANRNADTETVDLPKWLVTGLVAHLQSTSLASFTLEPNLPIEQQFGKGKRYDPLVAPRARFKETPPLSFDELSWPDNIAKDRIPLFKDSAHLFVAELLHAKDGKKHVREFLATLPQYKNWQFALLAAFQTQFSQLVDVEKWWALGQVGFTGRDPMQLWSKEESWKKLKAALDVSVDVRLKSDRMPVSAEISLQEVIQNWDASRQELYVQKALSQLRFIRFRVAPEFLTIVDEYRHVLESYLQQRKSLGAVARKDSSANTTLLKKTTCRHLDELDDQRSKLRPLLASTDIKK